MLVGVLEGAVTARTVGELELDVATTWISAHIDAHLGRFRTCRTAGEPAISGE